MPAIIVIGASEGGVDAIRSLATALPAEISAAVFVVLHIGAHKSQLPALLNLAGNVPAAHAKNGEQILAGRIYVAPPDFHLLIENEHVRLTRGPRENWARPAIDPLFRSAAWTYGADVIGVVLTGGLNDGTAGLFEIKRCGGTTIVQDPDDATNPSMPLSALQHVEIDHRTSLIDIPELLCSLIAEKANILRRNDALEPREAETKGMVADYKHDEPVAVTCPDCGGALRRTELGTLTQYRCHIGHVYTSEVMVATQFTALEWSLEAAMRSLGERRDLCRHMADKARAAGDVDVARAWTAAMHEAKERAGIVQSLLEKEWSHPGHLDPLTPSAT